MQSDPLSQQPVNQPEPSPVQEVKTPRRNLTFMVLAIFLVVSLAVAAGLGFWASKLNSSLTATQQQLNSLQAEHATLQSDYTKLKSDNEKLTTDLNQANSDLATAQSDLKKLQDQNKALNAKLDSAQKKAEILYVAANVKSPKDFLATDTLVKSTNDNQLLAEWDKFTSSPSAEAASNFLLYMISSVRDALK